MERTLAYYSATHATALRTSIEDLKAGYMINGCSEKNTVKYWEKQFKLLEEVEEKIANEKR